MDKAFIAFKKIPFLHYLLKWILLCLAIGSCVGSASALFLIALSWATDWRETHQWVISLLPLGGLIIGLLYYYFGNNVVKGNNLLLEEFHSPKQVIPLKMAPLVLIGTIITHLFGGSAGREGTAVQMGGAIADQFTAIFKLQPSDRKTLIIIGISAGFAAVFGTPLAGAIFALEVLALSKISYKAILPSFLAAFIADYCCTLWPVIHTHYVIPTVPAFNLTTLCWTIMAGILFGFAALIFSKSTHFFTATFKRVVDYPPFRPMIGGVFIALAVYMIGNTKYIGLGIPTIQSAFTSPLNDYDFFLKILFTSFTLGAGFKGGEVTPLFFIGATLGNVLIWFIPLPMALLAGMGFVAVFAGATHAPIACTLMGIELFGTQSGWYIGIACCTAYLFSGTKGIYSAQTLSGVKYFLYTYFKKEKAN